MDHMKKLLQITNEMKTDTVRNYVIAGLDSHLLEDGKVRLFTNSREHQDQITPHTHRFDFACLVLKGTVTNKIWHKTTPDKGDLFGVSRLSYKGAIGDHDVTPENSSYYTHKVEHHHTGEVYSMKGEEIHSIEFSRGAVVLFFEGPEVLETSTILEPIVDGVIIPTYEKKPYMFLKQE